MKRGTRVRSVIFSVIAAPAVFGCGGAANTGAASDVIDRIVISPHDPVIVVRTSAQLTAVAENATGTVLPDQAIGWSSAVPGIVSISTSGVITGVATGTATITASTGAKWSTVLVTVAKVPVAAIQPSQTTATLHVFETVQLSATLYDATGNILTGRAITWATHAAPVATVNTAGLVTATGPGTGQIVVTCEGRTATITITVLQ